MPEKPKITVTVKNIDEDIWWQHRMLAAMRKMTLQQHINDVLEQAIIEIEQEFSADAKSS